MLNQRELARLLRSCPERYQPLLATGAFTGMRLSELLALSWADIDFAAGVIHVRQQLARDRRGVPPPRVPPKTRASVREIPLLPQLAVVLRQHRQRSPFSTGSDYVFPTGRGTPFLHHNVSKRVLRRASGDAGLDHEGRRVRFHDLRHTFASHLIIDIPLDVVQVSRILGHARTSMTLDTYAHLFEEARHGADVRAELAESEFANLFARAHMPRTRRRGGPGHSRCAAAPTPARTLDPSPLRPAGALPAPLLLDQDLTNRLRRPDEQLRIAIAGEWMGGTCQYANHVVMAERLDLTWRVLPPSLRRPFARRHR